MVTNLKAAFGERFQVRDDGTGDGEKVERVWGQEIPGRHGVLYPFGLNGSLAVRVEGSRRIRRATTMGWRLVQDGDLEAVFVLDPKDAARAAVLIQARRRRVLTPDQRATVAARLAGPRLSGCESNFQARLGA